MAGRSFCSRCGPPASFSLVCIRTLYLTIALEAHKLPSSDLRTSATTTEGVGASSTKRRGSTASARLAVTGTWRSVSSVPAATAGPERDLGDLRIPGALLRAAPGEIVNTTPGPLAALGAFGGPGRTLQGPVWCVTCQETVPLAGRPLTFYKGTERHLSIPLFCQCSPTRSSPVWYC